KVTFTTGLAVGLQPTARTDQANAAHQIHSFHTGRNLSTPLSLSSPRRPVLFLRRCLPRLLATALECRALASLHRTTQRDRCVVRPVDRGAHHQILRRDDTPHRAAKSPLELVDAVKLLPRLQ